MKCIIKMEEIPKELVINWDHIGIHYVPVSNWTMAKEGSKRIEIVGTEDKRQITAVFANIPWQEIFFAHRSFTPRCLPTVQFPKGWHVRKPLG